MSLGGHLREFRNRAFWSALFIFAAAIVGWNIFDQVFQILQNPIIQIAKDRGLNATINFGTVVGAFDLKLQVSVFLGVLGASPVWLYNIWAFVTPGLKKKERRYSLGFLAAAVPLFLGGCALGWVTLPGFVSTLLAFTPQGSANVIDASQYMLFTLRILLVFGLSFVLPVLLVGLNFAGLLSATSILRSWRMAILLSALIAALATPTAEPMSMFLLMAPLIVLYFTAAGIAAIRDKSRAKKTAEIEAELEEIE
jgi:sec-independent protein translocase protein TatC